MLESADGAATAGAGAVVRSCLGPIAVAVGVGVLVFLAAPNSTQLNGRRNLASAGGVLHSHDSERTTSGLGSSSVDLLARGPLSSAPVVSTPADAPQYWQGAIYDDFDGTLWFFTAHPSAKTIDVTAHPEVNVSVGDGKGWLSMSGHARVSHDQERIDRYWNPWAEAYFDGGRDDPAVALLEVQVSTIEYWDLDKPAIAQAFEVLKGIVTKKAPDVGDSGTVRL